VQSKIATLQWHLQLEKVKEAVIDYTESQDGGKQFGLAYWWNIKMEQWKSRAHLACLSCLGSVLELSQKWIGFPSFTKDSLKAALKKRLSMKMKSIGRMKRLQTSFGADVIDHLAKQAVEWQSMCKSDNLKSGKFLFNRQYLREAKKALKKYQSIASANFACAVGLEMRSIVVNAKRNEACNFLTWYIIEIGSGLDSSNGSKDSSEHTLWTQLENIVEEAAQFLKNCLEALFEVGTGCGKHTTKQSIWTKTQYSARKAVKLVVNCLETVVIATAKASWKLFMSGLRCVFAATFSLLKVVEFYGWLVFIVKRGLKRIANCLHGIAIGVESGWKIKEKSTKEIFVQIGLENCLVVQVKEDLSDQIADIKEKVAVHMACNAEDFRLCYCGKDLNQGSLVMNGVGTQATMFVLGRLCGGSPTNGGGTGIDGETIDESNSATKTSALKEPSSETDLQQSLPVKKPGPKSPAERQALSRARKRALAKFNPENLSINQRKEKSRKKLKNEKAEKEGERRATFSTTRENPDISFNGFEQDPETAAMLYLLNSGSNKFADLDELDFDCDSDDLDSEIVERLVKEIRDEVPTDKELSDMLKKYCQAQGRGGLDGVNHQIEGLPDTVDAHILSCGSCGVRHPHRGKQKLVKVMLQELVGSGLEYNCSEKESWEEEKMQIPLCLPINGNGDLREFHLWKLRSAYDSTLLDTTFHIHPELVVTECVDNDISESREFTFLCTNCVKSKGKPSIKPVNSISAGLDLGDYERIGLVHPTVSELCLIARVRNYLNCIKVSDNKAAGCLTNYTVSKIRGHAIAFRHTAPIICSLALLLNQVQTGETDRESVAELLTESLTVHLLGSKGAGDEIARTAQKVLSARPFVVYQWLSVLKRVHKHYAEDPELPDFKEFAQNVDASNAAVFANAEHIRDKETLDAEKVLGDDVSHVRTGVYDGGVDDEDDMSRQDNDAAFGHSYVMDENQQVNALGPAMRDRDNAERAAESLQAVGAAFNLDISKNIETWKKDGKAGWTSGREEEPLSEFEDGEALLVGSYPHVFMYGNGYSTQQTTRKVNENGEVKVNPINRKQIEHLLLQYTAHAARSHQLLYYLFDHEMRHNFMKNLSVRIKKDPACFNEYAELLSSEEWKQKIVQAGMNPTSKVAKEVLNTVIPVLNFGNGDRNILGSIGDASSFSRAVAMMHRYGSK